MKHIYKSESAAPFHTDENHQPIAAVAGLELGRRVLPGGDMSESNEESNIDALMTTDPDRAVLPKMLVEKIVMKGEAGVKKLIEAVETYIPTAGTARSHAQKDK